MSRRIQIFYATTVASALLQSLIGLYVVAATMPRMSESIVWTNIKLPLPVLLLRLAGSANPTFPIAGLLALVACAVVAWHCRPRCGADGQMRLGSTYSVMAWQMAATGFLCLFVFNVALPVFQWMAPI